MSLTVSFTNADTMEPSSIAASIEAICAQSAVLALATADADGTPHANMAFYALGPELDLFFVSEQDTRHGRSLAERPQCSAAIWLTPPGYGQDLRGMQLLGECSVVRDEAAAEAFAVYQGRFREFARNTEFRDALLSGTAAAALYRVRVSSLTLIDEPRLGRRNYLKDIAVVRDRAEA